MVEVSIIAAFVAGVISFLSPCVLPLIPAFLGYLSGTAAHGASRTRMFLHSVAYVFGFSSIFAILGVLLTTVLENVAYSVQQWLSYIGGTIIILFGLYLTGLVKITWLQKEHAIDVPKLDNSYVTSFLFGAAFAVGWSPCVGAVLGSILALAVSQPGLSFALLLTYAIGLGIPFLLVGAFSGQATALIRKLGPFLKYFNIIVGAFLIILGILVFTQQLARVVNFSAVIL